MPEPILTIDMVETMTGPVVPLGSGDELITLREARKRGYGSRQTLMNAMDKGELVGRKIGNRWMVSVSDLDALKSQRQGIMNVDDIFDATVRRVVAIAPSLSSSQKQQLSSLLSA